MIRPHMRAVNNAVSGAVTSSPFLTLRSYMDTLFGYFTHPSLQQLSSTLQPVTMTPSTHMRYTHSLKYIDVLLLASRRLPPPTE